MQTDISKETFQAAVAELKTREAVAARFNMDGWSVCRLAEKFGLKAPMLRPRSDEPMEGRNGELDVYKWLHKHGFKPELCEYYSPYDLKCNGKRVEVKRARYLNGAWFFNIHRHGKLNESEVDVYILRLENVPDSKYAIHLIMPAPIKRYTLRISFRSLLTRYAQYFNRFDLLR